MRQRRWGTLMAEHRRAVIGVWVVLLIACAVSFPFLFKQLKSPNYGVDGAPSTQASELVERYFVGQGDEQDVIVFDSRQGRISDPAQKATVQKVVAQARKETGVVTVIGPFDPQAKGQVSPDGRAAMAVVGLAGDARQRPTRAADLQDAIDKVDGNGVSAYLTGYSPITNDQTVVQSADSERAESVGMPIAFVVMVLAFGAVAAAALPLLLAAAGLILTFGVMYLLSFQFTFDIFLLTIVTMIGTGIGIDYSMFIVSRFREELAKRGVVRGGERRPDAVAEAAGAAIATSGRTILFSGVVVAISVCSLFIMEAPVFREISTGVLLSVICTLAAALTLLPAVLAALGPRVDAWSLPERWRPADVRPDAEAGRSPWARWAHLVMRRPILFGAVSIAILVAAALPVTGLKYGIDLGTASLEGRPTAKAQAILERSFSPGAVSPVQIVVTGPDGGPLDAAGRQAAGKVATLVGQDRRVANVEVLPGSGRMLVNAIPAVPIDSSAAEDLVRDIRSDIAPQAAGQQVLVGGATATFVDLSEETTEKLPYVMGLVLALSLLFLIVVFRSIVLPIKAIVMNLLATGAAVGLTVAVFQHGFGESLLGFESTGFLQVYLPITVFVLLFGLSMDYEVFLIRRMREAWDDGHDNATAVAVGIEHTARPIAAAAAIMVAVFGGFLTAGTLELKEFGLALSVAIALDATLVRLVLVPAMMKLFGDWNWWLPRRLGGRAPQAREARAGAATGPSLAGGHDGT
ncbi:RND superfamily putative drug exporter [Actinomadura pelletieri DSM 43383]|uniref:RND superfamily putative drug exporter n=2 Tax=Actinomadura pelletieri TaxID=111805 RepID=A0A495QZN8_9ACTN|nr:RND superfamily putative drug exporter [Actinomadura pelletieri DSM 43383]